MSRKSANTQGAQSSSQQSTSAASSKANKTNHGKKAKLRSILKQTAAPQKSISDSMCNDEPGNSAATLGIDCLLMDRDILLE